MPREQRTFTANCVSPNNCLFLAEMLVVQHQQHVQSQSSVTSVPSNLCVVHRDVPQAYVLLHDLLRQWFLPQQSPADTCGGELGGFQGPGSQQHGGLGGQTLPCTKRARLSNSLLSTQSLVCSDREIFKNITIYTLLFIYTF